MLLATFRFLRVRHEYKSWHEYAPFLGNLHTQRIEKIDKGKGAGNLKSMSYSAQNSTNKLFGSFDKSRTKAVCSQ